MSSTLLPSWLPVWLRPWLPRLAVAGVFLAALGVLDRILESERILGVMGPLATPDAGALLATLLYTGVAYTALLLNERLALGRAEVTGQPPVRVGWAAFLGYAFSQALGSPLFGDPPVRRRLYTAWGVEPERLDRAVDEGRVTLLLALPPLAVLALLDLVAPSLAPMILWAGRGLVVAGVLAWGFRAGRSGWARLGASLVYWIASAAALHALLPDGGGTGGFLAVIGIFALAHGAGLLSRVPAGLGVFDVILLVLLPVDGGLAPLLVSIVSFRLLYHVTPLLLAAGAVAVTEAAAPRERLGKALSLLGSGTADAVPVVLSGTVFVAGAFLLLTGALPLDAVSSGRLSGLPLPVLELSHFLGSVAGTILLILAWGLGRRLRVAFTATLALLAVGAVLALVRGAGIGPTVLLVLVLALLLPARKEFFRPTHLTGEPLSPDWLLGVGVVLAATLWLGFFAYRDVAFSGELWWEFALRGDASRFLRASVGAAAVLLAFAGLRLLRTPEPDELDGEELPPQVAAVVASSPRPNANLVWLGDKRILMSKAGNAFVMYGVEGRSWISMGDPVGDPDAFDDLVWLFRSRTFRHGGWPVFYQATPACLPLYVDAGLNLLKLGEEAMVDAQAFGLEGGARAGMRKTVNKVEKGGVTFRVIPREEVPRHLPRLREISDAWLEDKDAEEKSFSLGFFREEYVSQFPHAAAFQGDRLLAFGNLWLGGDGRDFSLDLMRYDPEDSPSGVMQYLFARALLWGKDRGFQRFGLGMAPLSGLESGPLAPLTARMGSALYRHGEHFYNFKGLRAYKEKFDPVWEPRYLASPGGLALPRILANLATLVSGGMRGVIRR